MPFWILNRRPRRACVVASSTRAQTNTANCWFTASRVLAFRLIKTRIYACVHPQHVLRRNSYWHMRRNTYCHTLHVCRHQPNRPPHPTYAQALICVHCFVEYLYAKSDMYPEMKVSWRRSSSRGHEQSLQGSWNLVFPLFCRSSKERQHAPPGRNKVAFWVAVC